MQYATKKFLHAGCRGDIIYSLPSIKAMGGGRLYLEGSWEDMFDILREQPYLKSVCRYHGQSDIDHDFRPYAWSDKVATQHLCMTHWETISSQEAPFDLSEPWLDVPAIPSAPIVMQVSKRWEGCLDLSCLREFRDRALFMGFHEDWEACSRPLDFHYCEDIMTFAGHIKAAKLFVGNQSFGFALAEAMKIPRILSIHQPMRNCDPQSATGHLEITPELINRYLEM